MANLTAFLEELDALSRKHGVWIDTSDVDSGTVDLFNAEERIIAVGLYCDEDTQEYLVEEEF